MNPALHLTQQLQTILGQAELIATPLPETPLSLWLINPDNMQGKFASQEIERLLQAPPYWCFCWASGLALAQWILANPQLVAGKQIIDVGAGSGIVALAAKYAGAARAVACDLDPIALEACRENAVLNQLSIEFSSDLFAESSEYDLLFAADLLYDPENLPLLNRFPEFAINCRNSARFS